MATLYVTSTSPNSGKTAVAVAVGLHAQQAGQQVAWFKPVSTTVTVEGERLVDEDAGFVREVLKLTPPASDLAPFALTPERVRAALEHESPLNSLDEIKAQFARATQGADLAIVEGGTTINEGALFNLNASAIAEALDARALVVARWESALRVADELLWAQRALGDRLIGAVLNAVPRSREAYALDAVQAAMARRGVPILGVLPAEQLLGAMSVGELAEVLGGTVLTARDHLAHLVESLSVGAMSVDSALSYFRRKANKAVITGGDRADIQLAALETSTACLILTGGLPPSPIIVGRAEEVGVPIITVPHDTLTTVEVAERYFGKIRFHQPQKLERFTALFNERFDFAALDRALHG